MNISVLLATYRRAAVLQRTLESFLELTIEAGDWELIVADNANDSETFEVCRSFERTLPLHYLVETLPGKNNALNTGLKEAKGEIFIFTDDDIIADPTWLEELWQGAQRWPSHYVFGGKILPAWPNGAPWWGERHPMNQSLFGFQDLGNEEREYGAMDCLPYGANMAIRRSIFTNGYRFNPEIGPTPSIIYRMGSETEILQRLKGDGYIPVFLPRSVVYHQIRENQLTRTGLNRRNFRIGLYDINPEERFQKSIFSCSAYLWKQLSLNLLERLWARATGHRIRAFDASCCIWRTRGKIYAQRHYQGVSSSSFGQRLLSDL